MTTDLHRGEDGRRRCWWCGADPLYVAYHDEEWGRAVTDDHRLFEKLCLEGFQSGLSWLTILRKRESFRRAFRDFDIPTVARFTSRSVERMLGDASIVRHRGKIESAINNAKRAEDLLGSEDSLHAYVARFAPSRHLRPAARGDVPATTPESTALAKDLKRRGWTYVGPTTVYAFMQAVGLVDDHLDGCDFGVRAGPKGMKRLE
ncbi:MAG: DNA-3-methyladenine glycosylase I [Phycisphaerales bacterium]|nr:DNA-3-methyladenine glycosylase I [Phycisphaerales bacterium]